MENELIVVEALKPANMNQKKKWLHLIQYFFATVAAELAVYSPA